MVTGLALLMLTAALRAQDKAAPKQNGYTVTVELNVDEKGDPQKEQIVDSNDPTPDHVLDAMALVMAAKAHFPAHMKDGKAVKFDARAPFFFPIEDDEGPEANNGPKPKLRQAVQPAYPVDLRDANVAGGAILEVIVDAEGKPASVKTLRASHPEFEKAAEESVKQWQFAPAEKDGKPVPSRVRLAMVFETQEQKAELKWRVPPRPSLGSFIVMKPPQQPPAEPAATTVPLESSPAPQPAAAPTTTESPK